MKNMKKRVIKLKESDLERLVKKIIKEEKSYINELGGMDEPHPIFGDLNFNELTPEELEKIMSYVGYNKPTYKTDDGDLEHGTFDDESLEESEKWIQKAIEKKGSLRKKMGVHKGETIPSEKMSKKLASLRKKDTDSEKPGIQGLSKDDLSTYRQIMLAKRLKKYKS